MKRNVHEALRPSWQESSGCNLEVEFKEQRRGSRKISDIWDCIKKNVLCHQRPSIWERERERERESQSWETRLWMIFEDAHGIARDPFPESNAIIQRARDRQKAGHEIRLVRSQRIHPLSRESRACISSIRMQAIVLRKWSVTRRGSENGYGPYARLGARKPAWNSSRSARAFRGDRSVHRSD